MNRWLKRVRNRDRAFQARSERKRLAIRRLLTEPLEKRMLLAVVTGSDPANHAFDAPLSTNVSATFDEDLNAGTVTPQTFVVHGTLGTGQLVGGGTTLSASGPTATHDPTNDFAPGEIINVTVTGGLSGTATAATPTVYQFRTGVTAGSGVFEEVPVVGGAGFVVFGDADADGDLDVINGSDLLLNDGTATFTDSGQNLTGGQERDFADVDGDGDLDVVSNSIWFNDGNGIFTQGGAAGGGQALDVGDIDGDGDLDLFRGTGGYNGNQVWLNDGSGGFSDSGQVLNGSFDQSRAVQLGDFDNDGDLDAFAGNWTTPDRVWLNDGSGVFTLGFSTPDSSSTQDIDLGDFDNDGDLDVFLGHAGGTGTGDTTSRILVNDGTGTSFNQTHAIDPGRTTWAAEAGDMDADGDLDLVVINRTGAGSTIWLNDGAGNFSAGPVVNFVPAVPGLRRIYGGDIGDLNGDGSLDIWEANVNATGMSRVWLNTVLNPDVTLSIDNATIAEDGGTATVTASIGQAFDQPVTVDLGFSGDATLDTDYTASGTQIVISTGSTSGAVTLTATQDGLDEADEGIVVDIVAVANGQPAGGAQSVATAVTDDDDAPTLTLSVDSTSIGETGGEATITATLSEASGQDATVDLAVTGAAATLSATQIVISAGDTTGTATLSAVDDAVDEPDEAVTVEVAAVVNATEDGDQEVTVTVTDDDEPPVVTLAVDADSIEEDGGVATFTATMSGPSLTDTTIDLALSGSATVTDDYAASATQIVIAAGETSGSITVTSVADTNIEEGPETVTVDIAAVAGSASEDGEQSATTTIIDDVNGPDVTIALDNATIAEAGGVATITATLANAFALDVTVSFDISGTATAGTDYTASATEIVVASGATSGTITLTASDDGAIEGDESIVVAVAAVINGNEVGDQEVTVTVTDDESPPNVTLSVDPATIAEAGGVATFTATLSAASEQDVTVDLAVSGTAGAEDYTLSATQIVVSAGSTTGTVTATAVDDTGDDDDETIVVEIAAVTNANEDGDQEATVTIIDDDDAPPLPPGPTPPANSFDAAGFTNVGYTFDQAVTAGTATDQTFVVHSSSRGQLVGGATTVSENGPTVLHDPTQNFFPGEFVQATVTNGIGTAGGPVAGQVWQFRTRVLGGLGTFTNTGQTIGQPNVRTYGVSLGDVDADGDLDAFAANLTLDTSRLYLNDGSGVFTDSGQDIGSAGGAKAELGDLDGDGDLDALVSRNGANRVYRNDGLGIFTDSGQDIGNGNTRETQLADIDADGDLDAISANNGANVVWINDGAGNFTSGASLGNHNSFSIAVGDVDNDGDIDAFTGNAIGEFDRVWLNNGSGTFADSGQQLGEIATFNHWSEKVLLGDVDADGDLDVWVGARNYENRLLLNDGNGVFADSGQVLDVSRLTGQPRRTIGGAFGDFDSDGDLDILELTRNRQLKRIWTNDGTGIFSVTDVAGSGRYTPDLDVGDLDGDGDLDFFFIGESDLTPEATQASVWTNANPPQPTVSLAVDPESIAEAGGVSTVTANLSATSTQDITVDLDLSGTASAADYTASGNQIVIAAGETSGSVTVTANDDAVDEPDETVVVQTTNITGGLGGGSVTVTILDDDEPVVPNVSLSVDNGSIPEDGGVATFTATLSEATSVDVTVDLAISGDAAATDYTASATQIVIGSGETSGSITVTAVQDEDDEADESVVVDIAAVTGGNEDGEQSATTTIVDDDGPASFRVSALTGTNSGFVVEFNGTLDASDLNLYDAESVNAGDPDVTVTGDTVGPVDGSLAVNGSQLTFIATGDALAADTYTVTLRSAADGVKDDGGLLLDGDGDGTAGDDYSSTFTVDAPAAGAVTLSLPDVVRGPGQPVNIPATAAGLPLSISEGAGIRSVTVSADFDANILAITGATVGENMPAGSTVDVDTSTAGTAVITFTSPTDLPAGENVLVNLEANVPTANANDIFRTQSVLDLHSASVTDSGSNSVPVVDNDAIHIAAYFGDVSGNGRINAADAAQVARIAALLETGFGNFLSADPTVIGDITGNARLNAADASRVAQFAALIPVDQIPEIPTGVLAGGAPVIPGEDPGVLNVPTTPEDGVFQLVISAGSAGSVSEPGSAAASDTALSAVIAELGFGEEPVRGAIPVDSLAGDSVDAALADLDNVADGLGEDVASLLGDDLT